jgi:phage terminase large subunit-like protein
MPTKTPSKPRASSTNSRRREPKPPDNLLLFERFCAELRVEDRPFELYPEQLEIVRPYFDGVTETLIILSKKNGKSTLIAALVLFHLLTTPDADCVVVAVSRDQAEIILRQAAGFIRRNLGLQGRLKVMRREILSLGDVGRARVLAADQDTAEGVIPTLAIVDELHGAKSVALYDSLRMGIDAREGSMVTITIAGSSMSSPLGQKRARAYEMPGFVRDKKARRSHVRSEDGAFEFLEWCLNPNDDPADLDIVKLVNPAPWKTKERLAKLKAAVTPWSWLRLACGIWTEGEEPWVEPEMWDRLKGDVEFSSEPVVLSLDLGAMAESGAIAVVQGGEKLQARVHIYVKVTMADLEQHIRDLAAQFNVSTIAYNNRIFQRSAETLKAEGYPMLEHPHQYALQRQQQVAAAFYKLIEEKRLVHDGNDELRAQVLAGRVKKDEQAWRFVKDPSNPRPIDALIALAIGCYVVEEVPAGSVMVGFA